MVNKLLWEAQPPIAMSTTRGVSCQEAHFREPPVDQWCLQGALSSGSLL